MITVVSAGEQPALRCRNYFLAALPTVNAFTTIPFGCTPTGIIVNNEYSVGSSFRGERF
jgi:hypothetical protein